MVLALGDTSRAQTPFASSGARVSDDVQRKSRRPRYIRQHWIPRARRVEWRQRPDIRHARGVSDLICGRSSTPITIVEPRANQTERLRTPFEALSNQAQDRLRELTESLDPLGKLAARARGGGSNASAKRKDQPARRDIRLPKPGDVLSRCYKGRAITVRVLDSGFEYEGRCFRSLSGSAKRGWRLRLRRVVLREGGDDLDRFHADSDDLADEADDVLGVVGVVGVRADAGAFVFLHAVLIDDPLDHAGTRLADVRGADTLSRETGEVKGGFLRSMGMIVRPQWHYLVKRALAVIDTYDVRSAQVQG